MPSSKKTTETKSAKRPPARTPQGRENQLVSMAMDEAEKRIRSGSATSQLLTHFLKLGSAKEQLERQRLEYETQLLKAKAENIESGKRREELYAEALKAMRSYSGQESEDEDYD